MTSGRLNVIEDRVSKLRQENVSTSWTREQIVAIAMDVVRLQQPRLITTGVGGNEDDDPDDDKSNDATPQRENMPNQHNSAGPFNCGGGMGGDGDDDPGDNNGNKLSPNRNNNNTPFLSGPNLIQSNTYNTHNFENYMKQEVSLTTLTRPHVYSFYNKLRHLSAKYGIVLLPLHKLTCHEPIRPFLKGQILKNMSAELYHKLENSGCLPKDDKKIDSLVISYGYTYDGFNMLKQIFCQYCPTLQDGTRLQQPTWESSDSNLYVLQVCMQTFFELDKTMKREYGKSQKSVDFLNEAIKSSKYRANVKIFKKKLWKEDSTRIHLTTCISTRLPQP